MSQKYEKLKTLLKELFQLDQPDLDFGLYRVLHAKSAEVSQFLEKDLLPQVKTAFDQYRTADRADLEKGLCQVIAGIEAAGMNPDDSPKVKDLRARLRSEAVDIGTLESEVYDHLYSFFRRYYSEGDFLAKRVYKPGVYAIPYEGEEVMLHWANKDQYYVKTSEYLRDYAFRLRPEDEKNPMRVHFRLADGAEGEHGNVKAGEGKDRVFILTAPGGCGRDFIAEENGRQGKELVICFEYRPATLTDWPDDERDGKKKPPVQKELIPAAAKRVLAVADAALMPWIAELGKQHVMASGERADYSRFEAHLRRYTARNTFDYFIHKDLGTFLRRELDFYIKNEVMHLDDVENESAPRVEQYLSKIKVIRKIASKIIDFLAQIEDFQKKLWLKKKFVVETRYWISIGCIPDVLYPEIVANRAQHSEWVRLLGNDQRRTNQTTLEFSDNLTREFLRKHPTLMVDTQNFDEDFSARLLNEMGSMEDMRGGTLVHSDNVQALNLVRRTITKHVSNIFIDPPYNTGDDGFLYKDDYPTSTWLCMVDQRIMLGIDTLSDSGVFFVSIGDEEQEHLSTLLRHRYGKERFFATLIWEKKKKGSFLSGKIARMKDYVLCVAKNIESSLGLVGEVVSETETYPCVNASNPRERRTIPSGIASRFRQTEYCLQAGETISAGNMSLLLVSDLVIADGILAQELEIEGNWRYSQEKMVEFARNGDLYITQDLYLRRVVREPRHKRLKDLLFRMGSGGEADFRAYDINELGKYGWGTNEDANDELHQILGEQYAVAYPKPSKLLTLLLASSRHGEGYYLDYFAGSGTTAHAVINLNREDGGSRRIFLVEMGDYFDSVLLPRIKKVTLTPEWKDGKPKRLPTSLEVERGPRIFKVVRLESYEDALNNLEIVRTENQQQLLDSGEAQGADGFREQYILRYMLDVETRGSPSLLNVQAFTDPTAYKLKVKRPGSDESRWVNVDLVETFNWLIGLTVRHIAAPQTFSGAFQRDSEKRLRLKGRLKQEAAGPYWFRTVTGTAPDGRRTLVIWRKLIGEPEQDNLVLDEWFTRQGYSAKDSEFDLIYVNGGNNLENLKTPDDLWKVRLIEEDFHRLMFEMDGA